MGAFKKLTTQPGVTKPAAPKPPKPVIAGEGSSFVRDYLLGKGIANDQIGFNKGTGSVAVNGLDFLTPSRIEGNRSIASNDALDGAFSRFQNNESTKKTNEVLGKLETNMNTPYVAPEFNYDANTDPVYQAALRRATENANTAGGNTMAELNRRGILNSTITSDRLGQIQQSELGRVTDTVLPQLIGQAYQRHRDTVGDGYQQYRDGIGDLGNLIGINSGLNQNQLDNQYRNDTLDYQKGQDQIAQDQWSQEFQQRVKAQGVDEALAWYNARTSRQGSNNAAGNSAFGNLMDVWSATGTAPDGLQSFGIQPGTPYKPGAGQQPPTAQDSETRLYFDNMVQRDDAGKITNIDAVERSILSSQLTDHDKYLLYQRYEIPWNGAVPSPNQ